MEHQERFIYPLILSRLWEVLLTAVCAFSASLSCSLQVLQPHTMDLFLSCIVAEMLPASFTLQFPSLPTIGENCVLLIEVIVLKTSALPPVVHYVLLVLSGLLLICTPGCSEDSTVHLLSLYFDRCH